jgi:two-component system, sensor histidine kinase LadS
MGGGLGMPVDMRPGAASLRALWLALLALLLLISAALAQLPQRAEPVRLQAGHTHVPLAAYTAFRIQFEPELELSRLFDIADNGGFEPLPGASPVFGFDSRPHWFHLRLQNFDSDLPRWLLVLEYSLLDEIDVYLRDASGSISRQRSGDILPFAERAIAHRHPNFWIAVERGSYADVLIRVRSQSSIQVPLSLWDFEAFAQRDRDAQLGMGLYYGILIALLLYNLVLFASLRDVSYLYYIFHVAAFGLVMLCVNGLAFQYLWPASPRLANLAVPLSMAIGLVAMLLFTRHFLDLARTSPLANRLMLGLTLAMAALAALTTVLEYRLAVLLGTASVFPAVALVLGSAVAASRRGYKPARWFLVAWALLLLGTLLYASVSFGLLPKTFVTEYGIQIGSALELVLLSFALANRYAALKNENHRLVREAKEQLESRVEERTRELSSALSQLSEANGRLREFSRRDGLTGVFNRRHFEEELLRAAQDARLHGRPLSLIMADIDHFKSINDTHGHLAGDDCLRSVARRIEECVTAARGIVARYGGEEFAIVLPDRGIEDAVDLAERIRERVEGEAVHCDSGVLSVTISLGVTELRSVDTALHPAEALRRADRALYSAKQCGRNRVHQVAASEA